eukprot:CAMPEP_0194367636 /NCGR_PEP_ID=MMETSP0174-20130528/15757_1 /TAXON_ID=216777 /ORGANISM="Proboscia alata, Strain PI-D3" /LENGTH=465 /DNA_ID=CAMNT_0039143513 /DNA_START=155 /DNA_END=1552 /DNA_ORIENTATION=+
MNVDSESDCTNGKFINSQKNSSLPLTCENEILYDDTGSIVTSEDVMNIVSARQKRDNEKKAAALQAVNDLANFLSTAKVVNKTGNCLSRDNTFFPSKAVDKTINKNHPGSPHSGLSVLAKSANIVMTTGSKQLWKYVKNDLFKSYKEVGISPLHLHDCSMQKFLTMFIDDEAPHSLPNFQQEEIGDQHATATNWIDARDVEAAHLVKDYSKELELAAQKECEFYVREIVYCHPISVPMAPSSADAIKFQRLRRFGSCGVCIETITRVKDVPMTDSFFVEDIIIIEHSKSSDGSNDCVTLNARFQIRFVKYNLLQRLIERTTRSEFQKFFTCWRAMVSSVLIDEYSNSEVSDEQKKGPPILSESTSYDLSAEFGKFFSILIEIAQRQKMSVENLGKKNVPLWVIFIIAAIFALVYNSMMQHINTFESTLISLHLDVHNMKTNHMKLLASIEKNTEALIEKTCSTSI